VVETGAPKPRGIRCPLRRLGVVRAVPQAEAAERNTQQEVEREAVGLLSVPTREWMHWTHCSGNLLTNLATRLILSLTRLRCSRASGGALR
jgi:hypothetical protein